MNARASKNASIKAFVRVFIPVLKNDLLRLAERKLRVLLFLILTVGAIAVAVFFNTQGDIVAHIAVVSKGEAPASSANLRITQLDEAPPMSELVMGKYEAVVIFDDLGGYEIQTIKSDEFKQTLEAALSNQSTLDVEQIGSRGPGTNIIGFMMMFILMQGVTILFIFAEDKEKKQIRRIAASPVSFTGYLCAHGFFAFLSLLVPVMAILAVVSMFNIDIGFGLLDYLLLSSLICALAAALALFLVAFFKEGDSANMVGSAIVVLTSILAGCFYAFDKGNRILEIIITALPQKALLSMSNALEQGGDLSRWLPYGLYVIALVAALLIVAVLKTRRDFVRN